MNVDVSSQDIEFIFYALCRYYEIIHPMNSSRQDVKVLIEKFGRMRDIK